MYKEKQLNEKLSAHVGCKSWFIEHIFKNYSWDWAQGS